ncbi:MAG: hypothetical protein AB8B56_05495 [Crocinitomicaceae bacterium]
MKKTLLHIVCALSCVLFSQGVEAQVEFNPSSCSGTVRIFNQSSDDWTVNYYGSVITVASGTSANLGLVNADPGLPRFVTSASTSNCSFRLPNTNAFWSAPCAMGTTSLEYYTTYYTPQGIPLPGIIVGGQQCFANSVIEIQ